MERRIIDYDKITELFKADNEMCKLVFERNKTLDKMKGEYLIFILMQKELIIFPDKQLELKIKELNDKILKRANVLIKKYENKMNIIDVKIFKGELEKNKFYIVLERIDSLKKEGYVFTKHIRYDSFGLVSYDYELTLFEKQQ